LTLVRPSASVGKEAAKNASVKVKLPDNLTRYRVMAVAVAGEKQFGIGESAITSRLPIMARPSAPRFLNFGDRFELPVVVQNQTGQPLQIDVAVRAANAEFVLDFIQFCSLIFEKVTADRVGSGSNLLPEKSSICAHCLPNC